MTDDARDRLFALLAARKGLAGSVDTKAIPARQSDGPLPLVPAQRQLWFVDRLGLRDGMYTVSLTARLFGPLRVDLLGRALEIVVARHESLRASFPAVDGEPMQVIGDVRPELCVLDDAEELVKHMERPFDLATPPLVRMIVARVKDDEHLLAVCLHHIICDGPSLSILQRELGECYRELLDGGQPTEQGPAVGYGDYAAWLAQRTTDEEHAKYWATQLADAPALLELPTDRPRPAAESFRGSSFPFRLEARDLNEFCQREGVTNFAVLLTALTILLSRYSGSTDIVVGAPMRDESVPDVQQSIGMFANTVALRTQLSGDPTVRQALAIVRETCLGALEHQQYPWEKVAQALRSSRDLSHNTGFQVMFVLNTGGGGLDLPGVRAEPLDTPVTTSRFDLTVGLLATPEGIEGTLDFATDLFDTSTIARLAAHYERTLRAILTNPDQRVAEIDLLADDERRMLRAGGHRSALVHELVAEQAARAPHAPAVIDDDTTLSYAELVSKANRIAAVLSSRGVGPETLVALGLSASSNAFVGMLAILTAGGAYLPLDPSHPADRLAELLSDARPLLVVTDREHSTAFSEFSVVLVDDPHAEVDGPPAVSVDPHNLAYTIYTSGSTGAPKGVMVQHETLANLARTFRDAHGFGPGQRVLMVPPLTFDASVGDIFPALIGGAALVVCRDPAALTGPGLIQLCAEQGITMVDTASALWQKWMDGLETFPTDSPLRTVMVGGDTVALSTLRTDRNVVLFNHYGPTEATVCATIYQTVDGSELKDATNLPIGRPLRHVRAYVVDDQFRAVPLGVPGELCLGGAALARGYLGRPDLTADRFVADPFDPAGGARMYRTGDLVRWRSDGLLEFLGRVDRQIKVRGHRIEPAEVEAACRLHPEVRDVLVVARDDSAGDKRLVAYLVADTEVPDLRAFLRKSLPNYLVPDVFVVLDSLPTNNHGKVDHKALPAPTFEDAEYVEPSTELARQLAQVWAAVLGRSRVGANDDFFALGGHSLLVGALVAKVRAELGVELPVRAIFEATTLADFATFVEAGIPDAGPDLLVEAVLPEDIRPSGDPAKAVAQAVEPRAVLVTGSTGFIGGHLLDDVLRNTSAMVYCLVRADNADHAAGRIEQRLREYGLWRAEDVGRIIPLCGDLAEPNLGLSDDLFDRLAGELDLIYHCGAVVNHVRPYSDLRPANVSGTLEVLRLACRSRLTPVHMVSTLGVYALDRSGTITEADSPTDPLGLDRGYEQSKWVSDALGRAARAAGLPLTIHRPARVTGDSRTGIGPPDERFGIAIRAIVRIAAVASDDEDWDLAPVDYLAGAIGALARQPAGYGRDFHYYGRTMPIRRISQALHDFGYPISEVSYAQWHAELVALAADTDDRALSTLSSVVRLTQSVRRVRFDCRVTEQAAAGAGLHYPPVDEALVHRYLSYLVDTGHLPTPEVAS